MNIRNQPIIKGAATDGPPSQANFSAVFSRVGPHPRIMWSVGGVAFRGRLSIRSPNMQGDSQFITRKGRREYHTQHVHKPMAWPHEEG